MNAFSVTDFWQLMNRWMAGTLPQEIGVWVARRLPPAKPNFIRRCQTKAINKVRRHSEHIHPVPKSHQCPRCGSRSFHTGTCEKKKTTCGTWSLSLSTVGLVQLRAHSSFLCNWGCHAPSSMSTCFCWFGDVRLKMRLINGHHSAN